MCVCVCTYRHECAGGRRSGRLGGRQTATQEPLTLVGARELPSGHRPEGGKAQVPAEVKCSLRSGTALQVHCQRSKQP